MLERRDLLKSVSSRSEHDFEWNKSRLENAAANQALRHGLFKGGQVFKRELSAGSALRKYFEAHGIPRPTGV